MGPIKHLIKQNELSSFLIISKVYLEWSTSAYKWQWTNGHNEENGKKSPSCDVGPTGDEAKLPVSSGK